jgi:hypothetical protein
MCPVNTEFETEVDAMALSTWDTEGGFIPADQ